LRERWGGGEGSREKGGENFDASIAVRRSQKGGKGRRKKSLKDDMTTRAKKKKQGRSEAAREGRLPGAREPSSQRKGENRPLDFAERGKGGGNTSRVPGKRKRGGEFIHFYRREKKERKGLSQSAIYS